MQRSARTLLCVDVPDILARCVWFALPLWTLPCHLSVANMSASAAMSARGTRTPRKKKICKKPNTEKRSCAADHNATRLRLCNEACCYDTGTRMPPVLNFT